MIPTTLNQKSQIKRIFNGLIPIMVVGVCLYVGAQFLPLIRGPRITKITPSPGITVPIGIATITGTAHRATSAHINGYPAPVDTSGVFALEVLIRPGLNTFTIETENRYKRTDSAHVMLWGK